MEKYRPMRTWKQALFVGHALICVIILLTISNIVDRLKKFRGKNNAAMPKR